MTTQIHANLKQYRTLIRIINCREHDERTVITAVIPGWNPHVTTEFDSGSILDPIIREKVTTHDFAVSPRHLFVRINIGAESEADLIYSDFEWGKQVEDFDDTDA